MPKFVTAFTRRGKLAPIVHASFDPPVPVSAPGSSTTIYRSLCGRKVGNVTRSKFAPGIYRACPECTNEVVRRNEGER